MKYRDLRDFIGQLESRDALRRVQESVSPHLEMTAIGDAVLRALDDTPTRIPYNLINLATQAAKNPTWNQR